MKAILISIHPQWVAKILNGEKTIEIRKRFPKDFVGWVYIYCTKGKPNLWLPYEYDCFEQDEASQPYLSDGPMLDIDTKLNGKVCARFWVDKVDSFDWYQVDEELCALSCLTEKQLEDYVGSGIAYAIHITNLEIFDKPKEIEEFSIKVFPHRKDNLMTRYLTRVPQSWCYIEV